MNNRTLDRPAILDQRDADPVLRAAVLKQFAGACMDVPQSLWDAGMKSAVQEETVRVCRELGF
jgi:hypothetical protein